MSLSKQDVAILLLYYFGYSTIRNFLLRYQRKAVLRILVFHDVPPTATKRLEHNLLYLKENTNVINLADFFTHRLVQSKINTAITFDDGYKGWVSHAMPILKKLNLPATFFISSGFVDLTKDEETTFTKTKLFKKLPPREITGGLTSEDIRILVKEGFIVGGHTVNHINLELTNDTEELRNEIFKDKVRLEKITGRKIEVFSYPCGAYANPNLNISRILREAGYKGAVTVIPGFNNPDSSHYLLHRDIIQAELPPHIFRARVTGNHDAVTFIKRNVPFKFNIFAL